MSEPAQNPGTPASTEPVTPAAPEPATPVTPEPAAPATAVSAPSTDSGLSGIVDSLVNTVSALTATVGGMQPSDTKPVRKPWTHWGGGKK